MIAYEVVNRGDRVLVYADGKIDRALSRDFTGEDDATVRAALYCREVTSHLER